MKRLLAILLAASSVAMAPAFAQSVDTLYFNGAVYTANRAHAWADAVMVRDGKVFAVGAEKDVRPLAGSGAKVIDLQGRTVMPGLIDGHAHYVRGALRRLYNCDFPGDTKPDDIPAKVAECAKRAKAGDWIVGGAWASTDMAGGKLHRSRLDAVAPANPVFLLDDTGHNGYVNSKALEVLGFTAASAKANKDIGVGADGGPNGLLLEAAAGEALKKIPAPTDDNYQGAVKWSVEQASSYGITSFVEARTDRPTVRAYQAVDEAQGLSARVVIHLQYDTDFNETQDEQAATLRDRARYASARVFTNFAKLYLDGVPPTFTAALLQAYEPDHDHPAGFKGAMRMDAQRIVHDLIEFDKAGIAVKMHATGDASVRAALDAVAKARAANGPGGPMHSIAHVGLVTPADLPRFAQLNVAADVAPPVWMEGPWNSAMIRALGKARYDATSPTGDLARAGALIAYGSDWPSISPGIDPWPAIQSLVDRTNGTGQRISLEAAIDAATINAARVMLLDKVTGSIEPGKSADMIVLDRNPFRVPVGEVGKTRVLTTIFEGRQVYQRP